MYKWQDLNKIKTIADINLAIKEGYSTNLINVGEAWQERALGRIASEIAQRKKVRVILIAGPSSSGKSTLALALQKQISDHSYMKYEIISIDDLLKMSVNETIYEDDVFGISPEIIESAARALRAGGGVIIDHVITSKRIFDQLTDAFNGCDTKLIRVTCPREVLKAREALRGDRCPGSAEASDAYLFPKEGYDLTVDTHAASAAECAERIFSFIFQQGPED